MAWGLLGIYRGLRLEGEGEVEASRTVLRVGRVLGFGGPG